MTWPDGVNDQLKLRYHCARSEADFPAPLPNRVARAIIEAAGREWLMIDTYGGTTVWWLDRLCDVCDLWAKFETDNPNHLQTM
jgi:hypothetical protein